MAPRRETKFDRRYDRLAVKLEELISGDPAFFLIRCEANYRELEERWGPALAPTDRLMVSAYRIAGEIVRGADGVLTSFWVSDWNAALGHGIHVVLRAHWTFMARLGLFAPDADPDEAYGLVHSMFIDWVLRYSPRAFDLGKLNGCGWASRPIQAAAIARELRSVLERLVAPTEDSIAELRIACSIARRSGVPERDLPDPHDDRALAAWFVAQIDEQSEGGRPRVRLRRRRDGRLVVAKGSAADALKTDLVAERNRKRRFQGLDAVGTQVEDATASTPWEELERLETLDQLERNGRGDLDAMLLAALEEVVSMQRSESCAERLAALLVELNEREPGRGIALPCTQKELATRFGCDPATMNRANKKVRRDLERVLGMPGS